MMARGDRSARRGVTLVEVMVVAGIISVVAMFVVMLIPRSRETARLNTCSANLMRIGQALGQFDGANTHLPPVPPPGVEGPGPLAAMARQFGIGWFEGGKPAKEAMFAPIVPKKVRGFLCPADSNLMSTPAKAPVSYRANTGAATDGSGGPFAIGRTTSITDAEKGAGQDFTAGFAERRIGSGGGDPSAAIDYRSVAGPVGEEPCAAGDWRGDAGSDWVASDWRSTLYNHAMRPNEGPSCIAIDGKTARMGASSGHENRVNVLMLGGSVRGFTPTVDRSVWRKLGIVSERDRTKAP